MFIASNVNFDNTLNIKKFAETQDAKNILNDNLLTETDTALTLEKSLIFTKITVFSAM